MKELSISKPLKLPCGHTIPNRIVKSAMSENLCSPRNVVSDELITLYDRWGQGGTGTLITGNIMIDKNELGESGNLVVENENDLERLKQWAQRAQKNGSQLWSQINHPGRQSPRFLSKDTVAPSAVPLKAGGAFNTPRALEISEIKTLVDRFAKTAEVLQKAGLMGVQVHGAHGYLVSQFLSPITNKRTDNYGGNLENRIRFLREIISAIRNKVGNDYPVGVKINSADFQRGGFTEAEGLDALAILNNEKIDLLEISGGTYEAAAMTGVRAKASTLEREAYFLEFAEKARKIYKNPLMLTGGFRSLGAMEAALNSGNLDVIGIARPLALEPDLPKELINGKKTKSIVKPVKTGIESIDKLGFLEIGWYSLQIERLGKGMEPDPELGGLMALGKYAMGMIGKQLQRVFFK